MDRKIFKFIEQDNQAKRSGSANVRNESESLSNE